MQSVAEVKFPVRCGLILFFLCFLFAHICVEFRSSPEEVKSKLCKIRVEASEEHAAEIIQQTEYLDI